MSFDLGREVRVGFRETLLGTGWVCQDEMPSCLLFKCLSGGDMRKIIDLEAAFNVNYEFPL